MIAAKRRKPGEPVAVLLAVLICWAFARLFLWHSPFAEIAGDMPELAAVAANETFFLSDDAAPLDVAAPTKKPRFAIGGRGLKKLAKPNDRVIFVDEGGQQLPPIRLADAHNLLWMAALSKVPMPPDVAKLIDGPRQSNMPFVQAADSIAERGFKRWSLDSWVFYRPDGSLRVSQGQFPATYGSSQMGAVFRYKLAPNNDRRPIAYLRAAAALSGRKQADVAIGVGARPLAGVPIVAMAEVRASRNGGETEFRPAVLAVAEIPPIDLPLGMRTETYGQAGYVGGNFATAFADGQARIDRKVGHFDLASIRAGAGVWGGAQKGAARLDVGPTASVTFKMANRPVKLAVDYRQRVAGDALPQSGISLTLSSGF